MPTTDSVEVKKAAAIGKKLTGIHIFPFLCDNFLNAKDLFRAKSTPSWIHLALFLNLVVEITFYKVCCFCAWVFVWGVAWLIKVAARLKEKDWTAHLNNLLLAEVRIMKRLWRIEQTKKLNGSRTQENLQVTISHHWPGTKLGKTKYKAQYSKIFLSRGWCNED